MNTNYEGTFNHINHFCGVLTPDGTLRTANETILEFTESERKEVIGKKLWEVPSVRFSKTTQRQVRSDVRRAANNEYVRHELTIQGAEGTAVIDFSIEPLTDEYGEVTYLLAEGHDITGLHQQGAATPEPEHRRTDSGLLITYTPDADEPMSQAVLRAFFAIDIDIFEKEETLESQIRSDALNGFDWGTDCPHRLTTRLWGYGVEISGDKVRIFDDSSSGS